MASDDTAIFAVSAMMVKQTKDGFNYQLLLNVITAASETDARAKFGLQCKDAWPEHALQEVLAMRIGAIAKATP